jgi:hypothetical protein
VSRRYDQPAEVYRQDESPVEFCWRGRRYRVGAVLAHWTEQGRWWADPVLRLVGADAGPADAGGGERDYWRVVARRGRHEGVFDVAFDWRTGGWSIARALD